VHSYQFLDADGRDLLIEYGVSGLFDDAFPLGLVDRRWSWVWPWTADLVRANLYRRYLSGARTSVVLAQDALRWLQGAVRTNYRAAEAKCQALMPWDHESASRLLEVPIERVRSLQRVKLALDISG